VRRRQPPRLRVAALDEQTDRVSGTGARRVLEWAGIKPLPEPRRVPCTWLVSRSDRDRLRAAVRALRGRLEVVTPATVARDLRECSAAGSTR